MLGIMLGAWTCNYLYVRELHWIYTKPEIMPPCKSKMQTLVNKFKPNVWTRYDWSIFGSVKRYNQILFFCVFCLGIDCMNFFLKFILWVPADHKILAVRVFMWAFGSIACAKEYYEFISNKYCKRVGPFVWVNSLALGVEVSIVFKFGSSMFTAPFPWYVIAIWATISVIVLIGYGIAFINETSKKSKEVEVITQSEKAFDPQDPDIDIEPVFNSKKNN